MNDYDPMAPLDEPDARKIGKLLDGAQVWGYLLVRPDAIRSSRGLQSREEPAIVEEMYRILAPAPDDVDWADQLGWSDTIVRGDLIKDELSRLRRGEFLLTGRMLSIVWLDGDAAEQVRQRYFSSPDSL